MLLIPAIDIKDGECVRLRQGDMQNVTVFDTDPVAVARHWVDQGADRIHVVDLDGAVAGHPVNERLVRDIVDAVAPVPVQVGGGIRDEHSIETYLNHGVSYVILGTRAVAEPHFAASVSMKFPGHIIVGLDTRNGMAATDGWIKTSDQPAAELARQFEREGIVAIIHTGISRDGMMQGLNLQSTQDLAREVGIPVIASGGVSTLDDIDALLGAENDGVAGAVIGRAIYENTLDLGQARQRVKQYKDR